MPKRYTLQQKRDAVRMIEHLGSIALTAKYTGIPARTLRDWRYEYQWGRLHINTINRAAEYHGIPDTLSLRDQLQQQVSRLAQTAEDDPRRAYYAALAITCLMDEIRHLNRALGPHAAPWQGSTLPDPEESNE